MYVREVYMDNPWKIERGFMRFGKAWAFTLIELLVVISIIAMLMAILLPSLRNAREQGKRAVCMANLRSIGQGIYIYANDNRERLIPGDFPVSWNVWGKPMGGVWGGPPGVGNSQPLNLGHLLASGALPMPTGDDHVFFCPSRVKPSGKQNYESFVQAWGSGDFRANISYMFNTALDGFGRDIEMGQQATLSHEDKINFLRGDGSVHTFNVKPLVFDGAAGPELLQEVTDRYGVCFPTIMLHRWLEIDEVDLNEARKYLNNPMGWFQDCSTDTVSKPILLASVGKRSLVCDVVGSIPSIVPDAPGGG
ncbi:MAG: type II secretion system protein [Planctomycetota bacterium]|jgi:prepilin-type N-terminal cleavage/methylation domain-containing protein